MSAKQNQLRNTSQLALPLIRQEIRDYSCQGFIITQYLQLTNIVSQIRNRYVSFVFNLASLTDGCL